MARLDYGIIVKKNGMFINKGELLFQNNKDLLNIEHYNFNGRYPICIGDKDFFLAFKKGHFVIVINRVAEKIHWQNFQWEKVFTPIGVNVEVEFLDKTFYKLSYGNIKSRNYRFKAKWKYKNNSYEVIYGYGIDTNLTKEIMEDYEFSDIEKSQMGEWFDFDEN